MIYPLASPVLTNKTPKNALNPKFSSFGFGVTIKTPKTTTSLGFRVSSLRFREYLGNAWAMVGP